MSRRQHLADRAINIVTVLAVGALLATIFWPPI